MIDAGLPAGVLNVVWFFCIGDLWSVDERCPAAQNFVYRFDLGGCAPDARRRTKRAAHLDGMGGNAPLIVFEDDTWKPFKCNDAKLRNMGEACTAITAFWFTDIADEFQAKFAEAMRARKSAAAPKTDIGPIIDEKAREDVHVWSEADDGADYHHGKKSTAAAASTTNNLSFWKISQSARKSSARWLRLSNLATKPTPSAWLTLSNTVWQPICSETTTIDPCC